MEYVKRLVKEGEKNANKIGNGPRARVSDLIIKKLEELLDNPAQEASCC